MLFESIDADATPILFLASAQCSPALRAQLTSFYFPRPPRARDISARSTHIPRHKHGHAARPLRRIGRHQRRDMPAENAAVSSPFRQQTDASQRRYTQPAQLAQRFVPAAPLISTTSNSRCTLLQRRSRPRDEEGSRLTAYDAWLSPAFSDRHGATIAELAHDGRCRRRIFRFSGYCSRSASRP